MVRLATMLGTVCNVSDCQGLKTFQIREGQVLAKSMGPTSERSIEGEASRVE
jgi:hypothetical protein